jgi:hypothetical protein
VTRRFGIAIKEAIADRGYGVGEVLSGLEKMGITPWIPLFNQYSGSAEPEPESGFIFEENNNRYVCPEGKYLHPLGKPQQGRQLYRAMGGKACFVCPKESTCLPQNAVRQKKRPKIIYRNAHQGAFKRILAKEKKGVRSHFSPLRKTMAEVSREHSSKRFVFVIKFPS